MTANELVEKRKKALADTLIQFHPELLTAIVSDKGSSEIADSINSLIEAHCMSLLMNSIKTSALRESSNGEASRG